MLSTIFQEQVADATNTVAEGEPVEKTLSVIELITTGGTAGIIIITLLFVLLIMACYIYF